MSVSFDEPLFDGGATSLGVGQGLATTEVSTMPPRVAPPTSALRIGTGGSFRVADEVGQTSASAEAVVAKSVASTALTDAEVFLSDAARLTVIRRWFSLTITDLAHVLRVQRPTIYAWLASRSVPHAENVQRIRKLHRLVGAWRRMAGQPLNDKQEVLELLSRAAIDEAKVIATLSALARAVPPHKTLLSAYGSNSVSDDDFEHSLSLETLG